MKDCNTSKTGGCTDDSSFSKVKSTTPKISDKLDDIEETLDNFSDTLSVYCQVEQLNLRRIKRRVGDIAKLNRECCGIINAKLNELKVVINEIDTCVVTTTVAPPPPTTTLTSTTTLLPTTTILPTTTPEPTTTAIPTTTETPTTTVEVTTTAEPQYPEAYSGTIYYVSESGDDGADGSKSTPFASITKVNTLTLSGDDAVLFESSGSYEGTITVGQSGTTEHPITFGAYGNVSSKPKIYGSEVITGWTLHSGNIYKATFATDITQLFVDGVKMKAARLTNTGYNTITGVTSQTIITVDCPSEASNYYVGCKIITRTENWYSELRTVTASTGNTLTLNGASSSTIAVNQGVLLMNKLEFLDSAGEWFYDTATNTVYLWTPIGDSPAGYEIRGTTIDNGMEISAKSNISIKNLNVLQQSNSGIEIIGGGSDNIIIDECNIDGQDSYGIYFEGSDVASTSNHLYSNNTISNVNGVGIWGYHIGGSVISNNNISNIGLFDNWGLIYNHGGAIEYSLSAASAASGENTIQYNTITNCGYNGIFFRGENIVQYNFIQNACLAKSDGGGIYTGSSTSTGSIIRYNIIDYVLGTKLGFTMTRDYGMGIYLDENSDGCTVEFNTIINVSDGGIFLHKPSDHTVENNKILDARYGFVTSNTSTGTSTFTNNLVATNSASDEYEPRQLLVRHATDGVTLNNNIYVNGFVSDVVFRTDDGNYKNFTDWKTYTSEDVASTYVGTDLGVTETQLLVYNNTGVTKTFYLNAATSVTDENGTAITTSFTVSAYSSKYIRGVNLNSVSE